MMTDIWLIALSAISGVNVLALIWLMYTHSKLKREYLVLLETVQRQGNDITGLCTAAVSVDQHIGMTEQQLLDLQEKITDVQQQPAPVPVPVPVPDNHSYTGDIQKVRSGASIHELMQSSGLSHDEAALLIRLHGPKTALR